MLLQQLFGIKYTTTKATSYSLFVSSFSTTSRSLLYYTTRHSTVQRNSLLLSSLTTTRSLIKRTTTTTKMTVSTINNNNNDSIESRNNNNNNENLKKNQQEYIAYGTNMDQNAMMESDMLIAVDENDIIINNDNNNKDYLTKKDGHIFNEITPRGILHRAFSFFLFNNDNKLLLTKRSSTKITFPNVWTNTVCSHPLHNMEKITTNNLYPNEVDITPTAYPNFPGIKYAAIRKCQHELGINSKYLQHDQIQFITRFHYWAADTITHGNNTPWGEHEIDYILFLKVNEFPPLHINSDEVSEYKFVSINELKNMMKQSDLLWSPWFIGIMERGGFEWWENLDNAITGKYTNEQITYFNPPKQHVASYNKPDHPDRITGIFNK